MNPEKSELQVKRIEESISKIGAKVADTVEASQQAKILLEKPGLLLIDVQQELEEMYITFGDCD